MPRHIERKLDALRKALPAESRIGLCKICQRQASLVIDHDHKTGQIRSLLCQKCNGALGMFEDEPVFLERALAYIRYFNNKWIVEGK